MIDLTKPIRTVQKHYPVSVKQQCAEEGYTLLATWLSPLTGMTITMLTHDDGRVWPSAYRDNRVIENYEGEPND